MLAGELWVALTLTVGLWRVDLLMVGLWEVGLWRVGLWRVGFWMPMSPRTGSLMEYARPRPIVTRRYCEHHLHREIRHRRHRVPRATKRHSLPTMRSALQKP